MIYFYLLSLFWVVSLEHSPVGQYAVRPMSKTHSLLLKSTPVPTECTLTPGEEGSPLMKMLLQDTILTA